jgi:RNase H-fold protein (predicted Holliday junction resolvase)
MEEGRGRGEKRVRFSADTAESGELSERAARTKRFGARLARKRRLAEVARREQNSVDAAPESVVKEKDREKMKEEVRAAERAGLVLDLTEE